MLKYSELQRAFAANPSPGSLKDARSLWDDRLLESSAVLFSPCQHSQPITLQLTLRTRNETPIAMFQPAGFGSFHSTQPPNAGNTDAQGHVTHSVLLAELSKMYDSLVQKMVMENGALLGSLRADNKVLKDEIDSLRREVRSTYLANRTPDGVPDKEATATETTNKRKDSTMPSTSNPPTTQRNLPQRPTFQTKAQTAPLISAIAAINAPSASKPAEWEVVGHKKAKKNAP
ncbi:hypothetical protein EPUL_006036 [Erysiphe pulchra]|uniref:Uncharacterized protein n=1 Tax=Erysiphe pulchra TaxID=225359 RepID=A0A2S4PPL8_9PEZI|nr:hypothetical protein EPUL_006036 [Erysiphe pulchra]